MANRFCICKDALLILVAAGFFTAVNGFCNYDSSKSLCNQCECACDGNLFCQDGPPATFSSEVHTFTLKESTNSDDLRFLMSGWMSNFEATIDGEVWTQKEIWLGKYDYTTKKTTYMDSMRVAIVIDDLKDLEVITKEFFNVVQRLLISVKISNCPKLYSIEQRSDYPHYPLPRLNEIVLENLEKLETLHFLNSQFSNAKSISVPAPVSVLIDIKNNNNLKTIVLNRPLGFKGANNVELRINSGSQFSSEGILNVCFLKNKVKKFAICESDCISCGTVWLQAVHSDADNVRYNQTDFAKWGYPWHGSLGGTLRWRPVVEECQGGSSCRESEHKYYDWPVDPEPLKESVDIIKIHDLQGFASTSRCIFRRHWDPFMEFHKCFESKTGWAPCLEGCDCSQPTVECSEGPYYDIAKKRISISKEDLPHLTSINKKAFDNIRSTVTDVETFYFYNNPTLSSITADTRRFDAEKIKHLIITKCPHLRRMETFVQKTWVNLEYVELSQLGESFSRGSELILESIFRAAKPKLKVLDLSYSYLRKFPRIDFGSKAPNLRYLLLAGNKFTTLDMETLIPFYNLPSMVDEVPEMLHHRTPLDQIDYSARKTLNIRNNHNLVCDCSMALEHLGRVQSSLYWPEDKLTIVQFTDYCKMGKADQNCNSIQDSKSGCVYLEYADGHVTSDLPCLEDRLTQQYSIASDKLHSGVSCSLKTDQATYCSSQDITLKDYPYFYCDQLSSLCRPVGRHDPVVANLECDPDKKGDDDHCYYYQNLMITCPQNIPYGVPCPTKVWECNPTLKRCQFKYPFKRSDYKVDMCKYHLRYQSVGSGYWDPTDIEKAKKAWVGECGFRCSVKSDCMYLRRYFDGMNFCCNNEGFCSTSCFGMCEAGRTGLLCETDLNAIPLICPTGWGGPECSVKLCNKFFLCANGAQCEQARCSCPDGFFGPECTTHTVCSSNPCEDPYTTYCKSEAAGDYSCLPTSRVFTKYKFADKGDLGVGCQDEDCEALMEGSVCLGTRCGCRKGWTALKRIGQPARCLAGAMPCNVSHQGECTTIHPDMICSGNPAYIAKVALRPVAYGSFCLCALPEFFSTATGACLDQKNETADAEFLKTFEKLDSGLSGAVIAIICLAVVCVGVAAVAGVMLKKNRDQDKKMASKKGSALGTQLASRMSANKDQEEAAKEE